MDFDQIVPRDQYPTLKWNKRRLAEHFGNDGAYPFWVADMDFRAPDAVIESLLKRAEHGIYGYEVKPDSYFDALVSWYESRHHWSVDLNHIEFCPSVMNAISILIDQHSNEGDGVIIQPPVFFEFQMAIRSNNRKRVKNPLQVVDGRYQMDFEDLRKKAADPKNKILILCNPHNPVGRVWTRDELAQE
jgi:cystathionine beta-lyase